MTHSIKIWTLLPWWAKAIDIILIIAFIWCLLGCPPIANAEDTNHVAAVTTTNAPEQHIEYRLNTDGVDAFPKKKGDKPLQHTGLRKSKSVKGSCKCKHWTIIQPSTPTPDQPQQAPAPSQCPYRKNSN